MNHVVPVDPLEVLDATRLLVAVPSVNPSLAPGEGHGEAAVAEAARGWLEARGVESWLEEAAPGRPNLVARAGNGRGPTLVLCAHLDTVGTSGMTVPPFTPEVVGGRLYGRGSYDMKGSAGAIMAAAAALARGGLDGTVLVALVADEEHASVGAEHFVRHHSADGCLVTEPSHGQLILAHKGFAWGRIVTRGVAAHGSRWEVGVSAIGRMAPIIEALERFDREQLRQRSHPLVGPASLHCALVAGGTGLSTYAPECTLDVERRTLPGETAEQVLFELREVVARTRIEAEVTVPVDRPPLVCDPQSAVARAVRDAVRDVCGSEPVESGVAYWMDAAIFAGAGIPTVNYGPSGDGAHAAVEWVDVASLVDCARVFVAASRRFCAGSHSDRPVSSS